MKALMLLCAMCVLGCTARVPDAVTVLTYASPYSPQHPFSRADRAWISWIEQQSRGQIRIQPYWSGSLLSSELSLTELRHAVADIGLITPIYARGGTHLIRVQSGFYAGTTRFDQQVDLYRCLVAAEPQFRRELQGLKILAVQGGNLPGIITRDRPVRTLADLEGLRLRAPSELLRVLRHLGADPVDMPMGEVYSALAKGVLDGVVAPADTLKSLHFSEVAHHFASIAIPRGAYAARAMSEERWASLTPEQQKLLDAGTPVWEQALARELEAADSAGERAGRENGVSFYRIGADEQARFDAIYIRDAEERARSLKRYGIDGLTTFRRARAIAQGVASTGRVHCERSSLGPAT